MSYESKSDCPACAAPDNYREWYEIGISRDERPGRGQFEIDYHSLCSTCGFCYEHKSRNLVDLVQWGFGADRLCPVISTTR